MKLGWCQLFFILLLSPSVWGQQSNRWLSAAATEALEQIYQSHAIPPIEFKKKTEQFYLSAYHSFIEYTTREQDSSARNFMMAFEKLEVAYARQKDERTRLMLINLSVQKGLLHWMRQEPFAGTFSFMKGYRMHDKEIADPALQQEVNKIKALFLILIDQLPDFAVSGAGILGMEGDRETGFSMLNEYVHCCIGEPGLYVEAMVLYGYCLLKFSDGAGEVVDNYLEKASALNTPLVKYIAASLIIKKKDGQTARWFLNRLPKQAFEYFPLLYHLKGKVELNHLSDSAAITLHQFLQNYPGNSFKADAYLRLARYYRLKGNELKFQEQVSHLEKVDVFPTSADKQARDEITSLHDKPIVLIKARLLFDDGQNQACIDVLESATGHNNSVRDQIEWYYRLARAYNKQKRYNKAIYFYNQVISLSNDDERYFGPYSALFCAEIYLINKKDTAACGQMLQVADKLNDGQYKADIKRKISRLNTRAQ